MLSGSSLESACVKTVPSWVASAISSMCKTAAVASLSSLSSSWSAANLLQLLPADPESLSVCGGAGLWSHNMLPMPLGVSCCQMF